MRNNLGQFIAGHTTSENMRRKIRGALYGRFRGDKNPNWKGGRWKDERGYIRIPTVPGSDAYVYEHRLIMERIIGRKLKKQEIVHHINGDKSDNKKRNLSLLPNEKSHRCLHVAWNKGKRGTYSLRHSGQFKQGGIPWNKGLRIALCMAAFITLAGIISVSVAGENLPGQPIRLSEHFLAQEFRCRHCGELKINMELIIKLEELRAAIGGKPIVVTSGYRCPEHNRKVGGVADSQHLYGNAADIYVNGMSPRALAEYARGVGFSYVKVYRGWIHVDVRQ